MMQTEILLLWLVLASQPISSGGAPSTDSYVVLSASSSLPNERVLTAGTNI